MARYVIDAPTLVQLVSQDREIDPAHQIVAPAGVRSQALSLLFAAVRRGELGEEAALLRHERLTELRMRLLNDRVSRRTAWKLAREHGWETTDEAEPIAVCRLQADALVTVDPELAARAAGIVPLAPLEALFGARPASWLPTGWTHPARLELATGQHLRPIGESDVDLDYPAVMGSQARLYAVFGPAWGWPPAGMTWEQDRADLARHEREIRNHESFNYALFDRDETALLGCVYVDPPFKAGADADVCWWVVDDLVGSDVEAALAAAVPAWLEAHWPFQRVRYPGIDLTWPAWLALPDHEAGHPGTA